MKVTHPTDLEGRMLAVEMRVRLLIESFAAFAAAYGDVGPPTANMLTAVSAIAEEAADEMLAIHDAYVSEANAAGAR
jgi:hypothetical protein